MSLPPWQSDDPEDQAALTRFVINELVAADNRLVEEFARVFVERSADPEWLSTAREQMTAEELAHSHGGKIEWPDDKRKQGRPRDLSPYGRAARDVPRIRAIFKMHWPDKEHRMKRPTAEEIAADRWNLSPEDKARLKDRFQRNQ